MPRWPATLRARLTLWYTIVLGVPLVAFALLDYFVIATALRDGTERFIGEALTAFTRELGAERRVHGDPIATIATTVAEVRFQDLRIEVRDGAGNVIAVSERTSAPPDWRVVERTIDVDGGNYLLIGAYPRRDEEAVLERMRTVVLLSVPIMLAFAATGGYFLAKRGLQPVSAMADRAAEISASTLNERLPVAGGQELTGLARVVNALLDRLEDSFAQQRRFMADASHELRTPTAIVRTEAEVTLARAPREEPEYRASMEVVQDAAHRLTRIVDDLFLLARADAGQLEMHITGLYFEEVVHDATRAVAHLAAARGVTVVLHQLVQAPMQGDADLLGRVLLNLLDNAIKFSPAGGTVDVAMSGGLPDRDTAVVTVEDHGPGIPPDSHARIFERFYRVDGSEPVPAEQAHSGAGLGLSIARRIAELHGGQLELRRSEPGRTVFAVTLPVEATTSD